MKNKILLALLLFALLLPSCSKSGGSSGGGKNINSAEDLLAYLNAQPANSPDKPIKVSMAANEPMLPKIVEALNSAGKYVSLTLTGNALTSIPDEAFYNYKERKGCETLVSINIPNSVTSIGNYAFQDCTNLTSITIPDSVAEIGFYAFHETPWYENQPDGVVYAGKVAYKYKGDMPLNTSIKLLDGTKGIASHAFSNCTGLSSITIPNSVTSIGRSAFASTGITSVTIPNSVTSILYETFKQCHSLTSITIPDSVTRIEKEAFAWCSRLTSVTFKGTIAPDKLNELAFHVEDYRTGDTGDVREKYLAGGIGTYTRNVGSSKWTKQ